MAAQQEQGGGNGATVAEPAPAPVAISHDADAQATELFRRIYARVSKMIHPHHVAHEPGGKDHILQPLSDHIDVEITTPAALQVIVRNAENTYWVNDTVEGLATAHGAYFSIDMPGTTTPPAVKPGPRNCSGAAHTITAVSILSDGEVAGSCTGDAGFSFSAGGGSENNTGLSTTWADGARLSVTISSCGADATYLVIDWAVS